MFMQIEMYSTSFPSINGMVVRMFCSHIMKSVIYNGKKEEKTPREQNEGYNLHVQSSQNTKAHLIHATI